MLLGAQPVFSQQPTPALSNPVQSLANTYCLDCHDSDVKKGNFDLEPFMAKPVTEHPEIWEKAIRRLRTRQMPPPEKKRPDEKTYEIFLSELTNPLDAAAAKEPNPGRTDTLRRLNRTEYQNAIRDLLDLEIDAAALLPKDEASHGFDNVTVADLSPTLLDRYITAAQKISRLAVGGPFRSEGGDTFRVKPDVTQEDHIAGLPLGTRGGTLISHTFPHDAEYEIQIRLTRDRNEEIEGLYEPHEMEVLLDSERVAQFTVKPPPGRKDWELVDQHLKVRVPVKAGPHQLGVTFVKNPSSLLEYKRQPYQARFNMHRHPRQGPAVYQVSINGPYDSKGPGESPSRRRIFVAKPAKLEEEESCAKQIISNLARRAYRRPVTDADLKKPLAFFAQSRAESGFEAGIEAALSSILVNPNFLFRIEPDPTAVEAKQAYRLSDVELASRISFFLWSSIPDEELLNAAVRGDLKDPTLLARQVRRMLADERSASLARNFAGQWLHLRNLASFNPDLRLFPDFDDNLRQALGKETELFIKDIVHGDRPVLELLKNNYTYLDERLARHYGIPHVYGSRFRRVALAPETERGGLLRQGSILAVTSYATRTSPVIRGNWILANLVGTPMPPPPPDTPALKEPISSTLTFRERLAEHRANTACASCHNQMDPVGFALENFDGVGRWRTMEEGQPVDNSGGLPDGSRFTGLAGLEEGLLKRPEVFVATMTEKLLTFALGRGVEYYDAPAVRKIVSDSKAAEYCFSSIIIGIVNSTPFTMRRAL